MAGFYWKQYGKPTPWPYPIRYDKNRKIETDVLIIGGGIAGCWAASAPPGQAL